MEPEPGEQDDQAAEREQLGPLLEIATAGHDAEPVGGGRTADLLELLLRENVRRIQTALHGDERLADRRMELRAEVPLDLCERLVARQPRTIGTLARHRVEAVRDDQEVRRERQVLIADSVVPASVEPLVVELDRTRLGRDELEALEQARGQARMTADGRPLFPVEPAGFPEHGRIDRDLAEIVEPTRPAQTVDVGERKPQRARE